jgi:hypothetical protein
MHSSAHFSKSSLWTRPGTPFVRMRKARRETPEKKEAEMLSATP